ncbi:MAG: hypothetical protein ACM3XO_28125 [Bacteroidota bacterium]
MQGWRPEENADAGRDLYDYHFTKNNKIRESYVAPLSFRHASAIIETAHTCPCRVSNLRASSRDSHTRR